MQGIKTVRIKEIKTDRIIGIKKYKYIKHKVHKVHTRN